LSLKGDVYEFGSYQVTGQEILADLRPLFRGLNYFGCDKRFGNGVDLIQDITNIELDNEIANTVISCDTYEHVNNPIKATDEVYKILKPDGIFLLTSVMNYPIHDHPSDYWRFTPSAFEYMLRNFKHYYVCAGGRPSFPHTVIGIGFKGDYGYDNIEKLEKLIPPILT